jgi:hypothetical protein
MRRQMYEPTSFVRASVANGRPVVLVSMNYRMNVSRSHREEKDIAD